MPEPTDLEVSEAAALLARKGGRKGRGKAKQRNNYHYTVTMPQARARQAATRAQEDRQ